MNPVIKQPPVILLLVASSFSPLAMTLCIPALPAIGQEFDIPISVVQFAISIFLLGLAVTQPVHGVLADRYGRRPVLLWGFGLFTLASLACALVNNMLWFIVFRFLQAVGIATSVVVSRAMIRDTSSAEDTARYTAYLAGGMGIAPMIGPTLSGYLIETSGWRSSFFAMAGLAVVVLAWLLSSLPETRRHVDSVESAFIQMRTNIIHLVKSRMFWGYTLIFGFGNAAFFAFLTNAPQYFADELLVGPSLFGIYMGGMAASYVFGAFIGSRIIKRYGMEHTLRLGLSGAFFSCGFILFMLLSFDASVFTIITPFLFIFASAGLVNPPSMTGAVVHHSDKAATASGLSGSIAMAIGGMWAMLTALIYDGTILSLCLPVVISTVISVLSYLLVITSKN